MTKIRVPIAFMPQLRVIKTWTLEGSKWRPLNTGEAMKEKNNADGMSENEETKILQSSKVPQSGPTGE